jgi:hypothetical protein
MEIPAETPSIIVDEVPKVTQDKEELVPLFISRLSAEDEKSLSPNFEPLVLDNFEQVEQPSEEIKKESKVEPEPVEDPWEPSIPRMTPKFLRTLCKIQKLYMTPELNDKIYLQYKGFIKIENLSPYYGLKVLWLEGNSITKVEGLENLVNLKCLYLQSNCISKLENLEKLQQLNTLNISNNMITKLENLKCLPILQSLYCSGNKLASYEAIEELSTMTSLG